MIMQVLHCPYCQGTDIVKHGLSPEGKQRYRCRACREERGRTFLLTYSYAGQSAEVKQQIVDMAMNASGIRDTARVLHVSPTTVINELKKPRVANWCCPSIACMKELRSGVSHVLIKLTPCGRTFSSTTCLTLLSPHTCKPVSASWVMGVSPSLPAPAPGGSLRQGPYRPRLMACNSS